VSIPRPTLPRPSRLRLGLRLVAMTEGAIFAASSPCTLYSSRSLPQHPPVASSREPFLAAADHIPCSILSDTTVRHAARLFTYLNISKAAFIRAAAPAATLRPVVGSCQSIAHTNIVLGRWAG
jgi:hypothetical protein